MRIVPHDRGRTNRTLLATGLLGATQYSAACQTHIELDGGRQLGREGWMMGWRSKGRVGEGAEPDANRIKVARGLWNIFFYPRDPFAAELQQLPLQRAQKKQWEQKDNLSRGERGYRMAVLTKQLFMLIIMFDHNFFAMIILY